MCPAPVLERNNLAALCLVYAEVQAAGAVTIRSVSKISDMERIQTGVKQRDLQTTLEVCYSHFETDDSQR